MKKYHAFVFPKDEKYVPAGHVDIIPKRLAYLNTIAFHTLKHNEEYGRKESDSFVEAQKRPLRPDTTPETSESLGESIWGLISQCMP